MRKSLLAAIVCSFAILLLPFSGHGEDQWGTEKKLTTSSNHVWGEGIAADNGVVHVVWGSGQVIYRRSTNEGASWSEDTILDKGWLHLTRPLVAQGSDVWVVYLRDINHFTDWCCSRRAGNLYMRRSQDGGLSWGPSVQLTSSGKTFRISLAASGSQVHVAWNDYRSGAWDVYYRRSLDGGNTWGSEVLLASGGLGFGAERPNIAAHGHSVHVVWIDDRDGNPPCTSNPKITKCPEIYYKRSIDGGATWGPDIRLTSDPAASLHPDVATLTPNTVLVAWQDERDGNNGPEQYIRRSSDNGMSWGSLVRLTFTPGSSDHNALLTAESTVHLAWTDHRDPNSAVYYLFSPDGGATWKAEERVSTTPAISTTPLMAATSNYLHVIWLDQREPPQQIWYRRRALGSALVPSR